MKNLIILSGLIGLAAISLLVHADSITDTYATGDKLTATTMNNIKDAVNDNDSRIGVLEAADSLADLSCSSGEVAKFDGTNWACAADIDTDTNSGGDITGVSAGTGLTGGGDIGTVTLDVDPAEVQTRLSESCAAGSAIREINEDGTVECEVDTDTDTDTTYSAGSGLSLDGTEFSIQPGYVSVLASSAMMISSIITNVDLYRSYNYIQPGSGNGTTARAFVPISLPDNATVLSFECSLTDNHPNGRLRSDLERTERGTPFTGTSLATIETSVVEVDSDIQNLSELIATGFEQVDNANYAYWVYFYLQDNDNFNTGSDSLLRFYQCRVEYE